MALKVLSALETSKITVPTPSATTDAATKGYVDDSAGGGGGSTDLSSVVPAFSTSKKYAVNTIVSHNEQFYKCTSAVTTAGEFNASSWTLITLTSNTESSDFISATKIDSTLLPLASGSGDSDDAGLLPVLDENGELDSSYFPYATNTDYGLVRLGVGNGSGDNNKVAKLDSNSRVVGFNNNRQYLSPVVMTTAAKTLTDQYNGWRLLVKSTITPGVITFPTSALGLTTNMMATYEMYVVCIGSSENSFSLSFSNAVSFEDGTSSSITLARGYAYFFAVRYLPFLTASSSDTTQTWNNWKWVFNMQGKIPLATS